MGAPDRAARQRRGLIIAFAALAVATWAAGCGSFSAAPETGEADAAVDSDRPDVAEVADADVAADGPATGDASSATDALDPTSCAALCPSPHGSCTDGICTIACAVGDACNVVCPPGIPCNVVCDGLGSCVTVTCPATSPSCTIACAQGSKCGSLHCNALSCAISCKGDEACSGETVDNGPGTIDCASDNACGGGAPKCGTHTCDCDCSGAINCTPTDCSCPGGC